MEPQLPGHSTPRTPTYRLPQPATSPGGPLSPSAENAPYRGGEAGGASPGASPPRAPSAFGDDPPSPHENDSINEFNLFLDGGRHLRRRDVAGLAGGAAAHDEDSSIPTRRGPRDARTGDSRTGGPTQSVNGLRFCHETSQIKVALKLNMTTGERQTPTRSAPANVRRLIITDADHAPVPRRQNSAATLLPAVKHEVHGVYGGPGARPAPGVGPRPSAAPKALRQVLGPPPRWGVQTTPERHPAQGAPTARA